jgi:hypothetical protein
VGTDKPAGAAWRGCWFGCRPSRWSPFGGGCTNSDPTRMPTVHSTLCTSRQYTAHRTTTRVHSPQNGLFLLLESVPVQSQELQRAVLKYIGLSVRFCSDGDEHIPRHRKSNSESAHICGLSGKDFSTSLPGEAAVRTAWRSVRVLCGGMREKEREREGERDRREVRCVCVSERE